MDENILNIYCVDIGNTRTHCSAVRADLSKGNDLCLTVESSDDYVSKNFADLFEHKISPSLSADAISWCSVVPKYSSEFSEKLKGGTLPAMQLSHKNSPLKLDVKSPEQVGQDRIAAALGASLFFKPPYIVVDMGTAVTIDLVDEFGAYAGGVIAPGMHAFAEYLNERAAQLPKINPSEADYSLNIGKNTVEAMYVGCAKGFCKLADGIIEDIEKEFFKGKSASKKTVFTGGSISLLPKNWLAERRIEYNLTQLGLASAFILNQNRTLNNG